MPDNFKIAVTASSCGSKCKEIIRTACSECCSATGQNQELLDACRTLKEYMIFVERVRKHAGTMELNAAVERAVNECIREGILADFLRKNRAEAIAMCIFEYDEEREQRLIRKAEYTKGHEDGLREGVQEGESALLQLLISKKLQKGKSAAQIAEELEQDISVIEKMIDEIGKNLSRKNF